VRASKHAVEWREAVELTPGQEGCLTGGVCVCVCWCAGGAACRAYQRATQESDMRRDLTRRMMEPLTLLEIDAVTSGRRNRKGRAERNVGAPTPMLPPPPPPYTRAALCLGMRSTVYAAKGSLSPLYNCGPVVSGSELRARVADGVMGLGAQADGRMMGLDAFGHLSYDHFTDFQQAERLESLRNQHQVEEERTARREQPAGQRTRGNTRLFVSNLADNVDWKALMHHFEHIGPVAFCDVYMHRKGTPAVITNPDLEGKSKVRVCVSVSVSWWAGRWIVVMRCAHHSLPAKLLAACHFHVCVVSTTRLPMTS
jgi:hypothetical protein